MKEIKNELGKKMVTFYFYFLVMTNWHIHIRVYVKIGEFTNTYLHLIEFYTRTRSFEVILQARHSL